MSNKECKAFLESFRLKMAKKIKMPGITTITAVLHYTPARFINLFALSYNVYAFQERLFGIAVQFP